MKKEASSFIVTKSKLTKAMDGTFTASDYQIEGGFNKLEEAALRCLAGIMAVAYNGKGFMSSRFAVAAAFEYAEEFLKRAELERSEEPKTTQVDEGSPQPQSTLILS